MGGGHLSRPDFGMPQPDPAHPLTEFYLLLQHGLDREGVFALPALWADFQAPARRIYADEAEAFLTLRETPGAASTPLLAPRTLQRLCREPGGKHWLAHPKAEAFLAGRLALLQRLYKR